MQSFLAQFLGFLLYPLGMATLGYAVGWTVGLSNTPLVASMLPLVFGLAAGGAGVYLSRADLSEPVDRGRFAVLGASMLLFAVSTVRGIQVGLEERGAKDATARASAAGESEPAAGEAAPSAGPADAAGPGLVEFPLSDDPSEAIEALVLRRQLAAVGASADEQRHVLMAVALERLQAPDPEQGMADLRSELSIDAAIVRAGWDAARREGPLSDADAWERADARLKSLAGVDADPALVAGERLEALEELQGGLEAGTLDGGPALRAARGALETRVTLARAEVAKRSVRDPAVDRAREARSALSELVRSLDDGSTSAPQVTVVESPPITIVEPAPGPPPTAFGDPPGDS